jgi:hypothetical protein
MIPRNLDNTVKTIVKKLSEEDINAFCEDEDVLIHAHHGLGRWIRNQWQLWDPESQLRLWFKTELEVGHPDDISSIILEATRSQLLGIVYDPTPTVERFHTHWKNFGCNKFGEKVKEYNNGE